MALNHLQNVTYELGVSSPRNGTESPTECNRPTESSDNRDSAIYMVENFLYEPSKKSHEQNLSIVKQSKLKKDETKGYICKDQTDAVDGDNYGYDVIALPKKTGCSSIQPIGGLLNGENAEAVTPAGKQMEKYQNTHKPETQKPPWPVQANEAGNNSSRSSEKRSATVSMPKSKQADAINPKVHQASDALTCDIESGNTGCSIESHSEAQQMNSRQQSNDALPNSVIKMVDNVVYGDIDADISEVV